MNTYGASMQRTALSFGLVSWLMSRAIYITDNFV